MALSGFPEWLPVHRQIELQWLDLIRSTFETYGYVSVETPAVEKLNILEAKGEIDKEIYTIRKLHDMGRHKYGLHYDLTIPFSRYVAEHFSHLTFPFKRYQIQKVWRGERPQRGRYREFYQCDIDVINPGELSYFYDHEVLLVANEVMKKLDIPPYYIEVSNRKIYEGYLEELDIKNPHAILRIIDKTDKIGEAAVKNLIREQLECSESFSEKIMKPAQIRSNDDSFVDVFNSLGVHSDKIDLGLSELRAIINCFSKSNDENIYVNLGFVRGLDYYTGTIYEGKFRDDPSYGSICSGGRYDNLTESVSKHKMPGVGFSIGFTRIFAKLVEENFFVDKKISSTDIFIANTGEASITNILWLSHILRQKKLRVEVCGEKLPIKKQIKIADQKGASWFWIPSREDQGKFEVKNMLTGEQVIADPEIWTT